MSLRYDTVYKVKVGDDLGSATYWNDRFSDLDLRLNAVEGLSANIDTAAQQVIDLGIARINDTLQPAINALVDQVNQLSNDVATLETTVLTDQNSVTVQLNALLAEAQGLVNNLSTLGSVAGGTF